MMRCKTGESKRTTMIIMRRGFDYPCGAEYVKSGGIDNSGGKQTQGPVQTQSRGTTQPLQTTSGSRATRALQIRVTKVCATVEERPFRGAEGVLDALVCLTLRT